MRQSGLPEKKLSVKPKKKRKGWTEREQFALLMR